MHQQEEYEAAFGKFHERRIAPAQKALEPRFAVDGKSEREKMQRQEYRKRNAGEAVHQGRNPQHIAAMRQSPESHGSVTAATARSPRASRQHPRMIANIPAWRSLIGDHSARMLRTPMEP